MEIVMKRLQDLHPYENNPRMNDNAVDAVAESIKQYGFKVPIVVDGGGGDYHRPHETESGRKARSHGGSGHRGK